MPKTTEGGSTPRAPSTTLNRAATATTKEVAAGASKVSPRNFPKTATPAAAKADATPKRNPIGNLGGFAHPPKSKGKKK